MNSLAAAAFIVAASVMAVGCADRATECILLGGRPSRYPLGMPSDNRWTTVCDYPSFGAHTTAPGDLLFFAAAAHVAGALGTDWRSDVEFHNVANTPAQGTLWLLRHGADNSTPQTAQLWIEAGQSVRLADILASEFGTDGQAALGVTVAAGRLVATSRTYNLLAAGNPLGLPAGSTFGQFIPAQTGHEVIPYGSVGRLIQLSHRASTNGGFRTNLGVVNATGISISVEIALYDAAGTLLGVVPMTLPPLGYRQLNRVFENVTSGDVEDGYAVVRTTTPTGSFFAYASVVDNLTGDPIAITAEALPADAPAATGEQLWVVAAAHVTGYGGSTWRSDVEVHCWGEVACAYTIELLEHGVDNSAPSHVRSYQLAAGRCERFEDILVSEFGFAGQAALRVTPSAGHLLVTSRTFNLIGPGHPSGLPAGATFGQYIPGVGADAAIREGEEGRLIQLAHTPGGASGFRTNLVLVNATAKQIAIEVELFGSNGVALGAVTRTLAPFEYRQLNAIFESVTGGVIADGYAVVRTTTAGGAVFALASVVDNLTGDPVGLSAARVFPAAAEAGLADLEWWMDTLSKTSIDGIVDGLQSVGLNGTLDTVVAARSDVATRTPDGLVIDYGSGTTLEDGSLRSGSVTVDASGLNVNAQGIHGTLSISQNNLLVDGQPPSIGPTEWTFGLDERVDGTVAGQVSVRPGGLTALAAASKRGDLNGQITIDTAICPPYPIAGSLTLDVGGSVVTVTFSDRCDGGVETSTGPPPAEPTGDILAVEWSFAGSTSMVGSISVATGEWQAIGSSGFPRLNALARSPSGTYYAVTEYDTCQASRLITIDPVSGVGTVVAPITGMPDTNYIGGLAFSPGGVLYAVTGQCLGNLSDDLYTINPTTGAAHLVGTLDGFAGVGALDFDDATGTLYAWDTSAGLITINPSAATGTDVNPAEVGPIMLSIVILPDGSMVGGRNELYSIDRATGVATRIGTGSFSNVRGMEALGAP